MPRHDLPTSNSDRRTRSVPAIVTAAVTSLEICNLMCSPRHDSKAILTSGNQIGEWEQDQKWDKNRNLLKVKLDTEAKAASRTKSRVRQIDAGSGLESSAG
ncbi:hypothetical protein EVAR_25302_1 [Eumeta japonica]|uniref:Uncharacterized protein n=1 Tax=Eumeta variegata TaxID=151549 RepID=A0A4C1VPI4_EUMVA|nr:hypothetical protein EVAR_25302_1 [Eumeta japonica]